MSENKVHAKVNLSRLSVINRKGDELTPINLETNVKGITFKAKTFYYEDPRSKAFTENNPKERKARLLEYLKSLANSVELTTVEHVEF